MHFSLAVGSYIILIVQLPVMAVLTVFCRKKKHKDRDGVVLTKDVPGSKEETRTKTRTWTIRPKPPPNVPIAPPPKDPLDDTLRGVKSLKIESSWKLMRRSR
ncbi:unnamed protein product [Cylicocyclus nassatus]|uniref:Uncharacterized protein n=1 Tax=Cylicocyclus nassatus TaxID=53992 RepID=A0AA36H237_CYLNA|nr:unnamed protein product [Cylicocyclus nassatus]